MIVQKFVWWSGNWHIYFIFVFCFGVALNSGFGGTRNILSRLFFALQCFLRQLQSKIGL